MKKRTFHDLDGRIKSLEYVGPGKRMCWREKKNCTTTIWYCAECDKNVRIPDVAWDEMKIKYLDQGETN